MRLIPDAGSMVKQAHSRKGHYHAVFIADADDLIVAD